MPPFKFGDDYMTFKTEYKIKKLKNYKELELFISTINKKGYDLINVIKDEGFLVIYKKTLVII